MAQTTRQRSHDEDMRLIRQAQAGDRGASDRMIRKHHGLVNYVIRYMRLVGSRHRDDFEAAGLVGILNAVNRFDCSRGIRFSTYATPAIFFAIQRI